MVRLFGEKHRCQTCGAEFDSEDKLTEHAKMHMQASSQRAADTYKCATCGAAFTSEAHLDEHTRKAHMDFADLNRERAPKGMNLSIKKERRKQDKATDDLRGEVEMLDIMLSSLVDVLEERRIIDHDEWKRRTKERLSSK
jgi:DNA-directed RNA polymerase subunit RPC12/RpoP